MLDGRIEGVEVGVEDGRLSFHRSGFRLEQKENRSAARPATCGQAMEVPEIVAYVLFGNVLRMFSPGAATCTWSAP